MHLIEIFRAGRHVAQNGAAVSFSEKDIDDIVNAYDPAVHEAPIVVGHPKDNAPAFGWVKKLSRSGATLSAQPHEVDASFAEAVKQKRYKKVSASFYRPESASNPTPGKWYLRHVGFLGAQPPAVKGLRDASFADGDADHVLVELAEGESETEAIKEAVDANTPLGRLRAWVIKMFGLANADEALPLEALGGAAAAPAPAADANANGAADLGETDPAKLSVMLFESLGLTLTDEEATAAKEKLKAVLAKELAPEEPKPADGEPKKPATETVDNAEPTAQEKALTEREKKLAERERALKRNEHVSFVEGLIREGRPMKRDTIVGIIEALETVNAEAVSFGENETRAVVDIFKDDVLKRIPKLVELEELAGGSFAETDDPVVVASAAKKYQAEQAAKGNHITTTEAVNHVKGTR